MSSFGRGAFALMHRSRTRLSLRAVGGLAVTCLCVYVLLTHVSEVTVNRVKLVQVPQTAGRIISVEVPAPARRSPLVVFVCRVRNSGDSPVTLTAHYGRSELGTVSVASGKERRIDFTARADGNHLVIESDRNTWILEYLEVANVHGFTRGLVNLFVVPAGQALDPPAFWSALVAVAALAVFGLASPLSFGLWGRWIHAALCAVVVLLFTAAAGSDLISRYAVVLSLRTFTLACLVLLLNRAVTGMRVASAALVARPRVAVLLTGILAASLFASAMRQTLNGYGNNYSGFLHISRTYAQNLPFLKSQPGLAPQLITYEFGYDGQFMFGMAFDPTISAFRDEPSRYLTVADSPAYRYGRIGFSALTALVTGGQAYRYPAAMVWLIVSGHLLLGLSLGAFARHYGWHPLVGLAYLTIPSFMPSLLFALPEVLAAAGLVGGVLFWTRNRAALAAACFAASGLVRETGLLGTGCTALRRGIENVRAQRIGPDAADLEI